MVGKGSELNIRIGRGWWRQWHELERAGCWQKKEKKWLAGGDVK